MSSRHIEQVDVDTGEILRGNLVYIPYKPQHTERFFMAFQDALMEIARDDQLTLEPKNVLLYLLGNLSFENYLHISQKDIADALGMHPSHVSRAIKLLTAKGIILNGPQIGKTKTYRLSPNLGWKGRVTNLEKYKRDQLRVIQGGKDSAPVAPETEEIPA